MLSKHFHSFIQNIYLFVFFSLALSLSSFYDLIWFDLIVMMASEMIWEKVSRRNLLSIFVEGLSERQ